MKEHQKNYISYASVAVIKYPDRTNLRRFGFFSSLWFQRDRQEQ